MNFYYYYFMYFLEIYIRMKIFSNRIYLEKLRIEIYQMESDINEIFIHFHPNVFLLF